MIFGVLSSLRVRLFCSFSAFLFILIVIKFDLSESLLLNLFGYFLLIIGCFIFFVSSADKSIFSPVGFFLISFFIFLLSRFFLSLFLEYPLVEAGYEFNEKDLRKVFFELIFYFFLILNFFLISKYYGDKFNGSFLVFKKISYFKNRTISKFFFGLALCFLTLFLYYSVEVGRFINSVDYLSFAGSYELMWHIKFFFIGKFFVLGYIIFSRNEKKFLCSSFFLAFFSIGFLLVGLRGYFVCYFLLMLYFVDLYKKINFKYALIIFFGVLMLSAYVLENRLKSELFDGLIEIISKTLHQQGATLEVMHGVVNYSSEVEKCVSEYGYFSNLTDFGVCVDQARGVFFEYGGFSTSFFAEIHYLRNGIGFILALVFSHFLCNLDRFSLSYRRNKKNEFFGLFLYALMPNLVYIARSDATDFLWKYLQVFILILTLNLIKKKFPLVKE